MSDEPILIKEHGYVTDRNGTEYIPFTDGWAVGFKVVPPDGVVQWIYLNPSSEEDDEQLEDGSWRLGTSNVFVYHDEDDGSDKPHYCGAVIHLVTHAPTTRQE